MEEYQERHILRNLSDLVDNTECNIACITVLEENYVFGKDDVSHLEAIADKRKRVFEFYQLIMKKADSYGHLLTAMERGKQSGALAILKGLDSKRHTSRMDEHPKPCSSRATIKQTQVHKLVPTYYTKPNHRPIRFDVLDPVRLFTGRVEELEQVHQKLQQNDTKIAVISQMASIVGLGGIGKTELARTYMKKYAEEYDNNLIWINAETEETLMGCFRRLATDYLKLSNDKDKKITTLIDEVYNFFNGVRSLFVFDNAESNEYIQNFMPLRLTEKPYILITSRDKDWSFGVEMLELHEMNEQEAIQFVKTGLQIPDDHSIASIIQLVNRLQCFPLAISQAISYIKQKRKLRRFSIEDYLKVLESCTAELLNSKRPAAELNTYTKTTMTTWKVTTDLISTIEDVGSQAILLLNMISYFQPDKIPIKLLQPNREDEENFEKKRQQREDAIGLLVKYSMVNIQPLQETLSVHRLVQEVTRNQLKQDGEEQNILRYSMNFLYEYENLDVVNHACSVFKYCAPHKSLVIEFKYIPFYILDILNTHGGSLYGLKIADELRGILLKHISSTDVDVIRLDKRMAMLEYKMGNYDNAFKEFIRLLPHFEENQTGLFTEDEILYTQQYHTKLLRHVGRQIESLNFHTKLYKKLIALKGQDDSQTVDTLVDIADCLIELGHFKQHPPLNVEYLHILPEGFGTKSPWKIISLLKTAYERKKHLIGSNIEYANTLFRVSMCVYDLEDKEEAGVVARDIYERGKNSKDSRIQSTSLNCLNLLAIIKDDEGKYEDALRMYEKVHLFHLNTLGDSHIETLIIKRNMLLTQQTLGNLETALDGFREVLKKMLTHYPDSFYISDVELDVAITLYKMKRYDKSLKLLLDLKAKLKEKCPHLVSDISDVNDWIEEVHGCIGCD